MERPLFRMPVRRVILCGGLVVLIALLPVLYWLPAMAAWLAGKELEDRGIELSALDIEHLGPTRFRSNGGQLQQAPWSFRWEALEAEYAPLSLLRGDIRQVYLRGAHVQLDALPTAEALSSAPEPAVDQDTGEEIAREKPLPAGAAGPPPEVPPAAGAGETPALSLNGLLANFLPVLDPSPLFKDLPLERLIIDAGRFRLGRPEGEADLELPWTFLYARDGALVDADLSVRDPRLSLNVHYKGRTGTWPASLFLTTAFPVGGATAFLQPFTGTSLSALDDLEGRMGMEALVEFSSRNRPRATLEVEVEALKLPFPGRQEGRLAVESGLMILTHQQEETRIDGSFRMAPELGGGFLVEPFALRVGYRWPDGWHMETEPFRFERGGWMGRLAARGAEVGAAKSLLPERLRMEIAMESLGFNEAVKVEPFSFLLEGTRKNLALKASPMGLKRNGTLWIEDVDLRMGAEEEEARFSMAWFNRSGLAMGTAEAEVQGVGGPASKAGFRLRDAEGTAHLEGSFTSGEGGEALALGGRLDLAWVEALLGWWSDLAVDLQGPRPELSVDVEHRRGRLQGGLSLSLQDLEVSGPGGTRLSGLSGEGNLLLDLFPRSDGWQSLSAQELEMGGVVLESLHLDWQLPRMDHLAVRNLGARFADGNLLLSPFAFDPRAPEVATSLSVSGIRASALLGMLKEDRFALEGSLSGGLRLHWDGERLRLGEVRLSLDTGASAPRRFYILDEALVDSAFAGLAGTAAEVRGMLGRALRDNGVEIKQLEAALVPTTDEGMLNFRILISGRTRNTELDLPIEQLVLNNLVSKEDLARVLGWLGPIELLP